jgi:molecular chaperone GrpE
VPNERSSKSDPPQAAEADQRGAPDSTPQPSAAEGERPRAAEAPGGEAALRKAAAERSAAEMAAAAEKARQEAGSPPQSLSTELKQAQDRALRMQAELENYRKRATREMQEHRRYANLPLLRDLLPVLDNLRRAIEAAEKTHDAASLLEGVKMVAQQLEDVLQRHHCVPIQALHEPFDPHLHEAVSQQASDEHPAGTVVVVTQDGFRLHDRVVRPSQVIVSRENQSAEESHQAVEKKESS